MPVESQRPERPLIRMLLSAYQRGVWSTAKLDWLKDKVDGAVEVIARRSDGATLAIEHTLVQPFVDEKFDSKKFITAFRRIEGNPALALPERQLDIQIPVHAIPTGYSYEDVGADLLAWLTANHAAAHAEGETNHKVPVCRGSKKGPLELDITLRTIHLSGKPGSCRIMRKNMPCDLSDVVRKALRTKVEKLAQTPADKRILLLEKGQPLFSELEIYQEVVQLAPAFPKLGDIHEIWFVDTHLLANEGFAWFNLLDGRGYVETLTFEHGALTEHRDHRPEAHRLVVPVVDRVREDAGADLTTSRFQSRASSPSATCGQPSRENRKISLASTNFG